MPPLVTSYILRAPPPSELPSPLPERERDVLVAPGLPMKDAALSQQCSNKHISESPLPKMLISMLVACQLLWWFILDFGVNCIGGTWLYTISSHYLWFYKIAGNSNAEPVLRGNTGLDF